MLKMNELLCSFSGTYLVSNLYFVFKTSLHLLCPIARLPVAIHLLVSRKLFYASLCVGGLLEYLFEQTLSLITAGLSIMSSRARGKKEVQTKAKRSAPEVKKRIFLCDDFSACSGTSCASTSWASTTSRGAFL